MAHKPKTPGNKQGRDVQTHISAPVDPCVRAENEDDDGYDPYSDRSPDPQPLFEPDPWN